MAQSGWRQPPGCLWKDERAIRRWGDEGIRWGERVGSECRKRRMVRGWQSRSEPAHGVKLRARPSSRRLRIGRGVMVESDVEAAESRARPNVRCGSADRGCWNPRKVSPEDGVRACWLA